MRIQSISTHAGFLAAVGVFVACIGAAPAEPPQRGHFARSSGNHLQNLLEKMRVKHALPGLAATVVSTRGRSAAAVTGVRNIASSDRILATDRFHIASCTKSMTAMLAAVAVHRGELRWSTRMIDVLPELASVVRAEFRNATLEQLLAHRAMMPPYTQFGPQRLEELKRLPGTPTQQRLRFLRDVLSTESPNTGTGDGAYSNVGYTAAAAMLERSSGVAWEKLILSRVTKPLGMSSVRFGWPATTADPHQPRGHYVREGRVQAQPLDDAYMLPVVIDHENRAGGFFRR